jgi:hypothetical protein
VLDFLWKEYNRRSDYVRYLVRARQKLLGALAHIRVSFFPLKLIFMETWKSTIICSVCREQEKELKKAEDVISYLLQLQFC